MRNIIALFTLILILGAQTSSAQEGESLSNTLEPNLELDPLVEAEEAALVNEGVNEEEASDELVAEPIDDIEEFPEPDSPSEALSDAEELRDDSDIFTAEEATEEAPEELPTNQARPQSKIQRNTEVERAIRPEKKVKYIRHPFAEKGLLRIDKDQVYHYKVDRSEISKSSSLRFGYFDPTELQNNNGDSISTIYPDSESLMLLYDYEWQWLRGSFGRLNIKAGTGVYSVSGNGVYETISGTPEEKFTLIAFPNSVSLVYYLQYWDNQPIVPYLDAGADLFAFAERRDDDLNPALGAKIGSSFAAHVAGGVAFSLNSLDRKSVLELDNEYGINNLWLNVEFRAFIGSGDFNFTGNFLNAGVAVEF